MAEIAIQGRTGIPLVLEDNVDHDTDVHAGIYILSYSLASMLSYTLPTMLTYMLATLRMLGD